MGDNPTQQNHGVPTIERDGGSRSSARSPSSGQRFTYQIGIHDQLACLAIHRAAGERRDDGDIALQHIPMDGEKVASLLVIRIGPPAQGGNVEPAHTGQRLGHLLAAVQLPMKITPSA